MNENCNISVAIPQPEDSKNENLILQPDSDISVAIPQPKDPKNENLILQPDSDISVAIPQPKDPKNENLILQPDSDIGVAISQPKDSKNENLILQPDSDIGVAISQPKDSKNENLILQPDSDISVAISQPKDSKNENLILQPDSGISVAIPQPKDSKNENSIFQPDSDISVAIPQAKVSKNDNLILQPDSASVQSTTEYSREYSPQKTFSMDSISLVQEENEQKESDSISTAILSDANEVLSVTSLEGSHDTLMETEDIQLHEVSSTERTSINKPRIITNEICQTKILLCRDFFTEDIISGKSLSFNENEIFIEEKESSFHDDFQNIEIFQPLPIAEVEGFPGFSKEEIDLSLEKTNQIHKKERDSYNFPSLYRNTIISRPDSPPISFLRFNLPDQVEPLGTIIYKRNLIRPSMFNCRSTGYTELDSLMQKCSLRDRRESRERKLILRKAKLELNIKQKLKNPKKKKHPDIHRIRTRSSLDKLSQPLEFEETPKNIEEKEELNIQRVRTRSSLDKLSQPLEFEETPKNTEEKKESNNSVQRSPLEKLSQPLEFEELKNTEEEEESNKRVQTRSSLNKLSEPLEFEETPKPLRRTVRARKLLISKSIEPDVKEVSILLNRSDVGFYQKNLEKSTPVKETIFTSDIDGDHFEENNNYKEYEHLEYLDLSPSFEFYDSSDETQPLLARKNSTKKGTATRRSLRLNKHVLKGIILKSKLYDRIKKRVSFAGNVVKYEY